MCGESSESSELFQLSVWFSGRVQGVGFRYETLQIAKGFEVSGFVKNLLDGRVQLEAEGEEAEVLAFVAQVEEELSGFIRMAEKRSAKGGRRFSGFVIL